MYVQHYSSYITCVDPFNHHIFPGGSDGKGPASWEWVGIDGNVGNLGSIPGLGRYPGGGQVTHSIILAWRIPMWSLVGYSPQDRKELDMTE